MRNTKYKKTYANLVKGHVDILCTYQGAKIKMTILAWLCRFKYYVPISVDATWLKLGHYHLFICLKWEKKIHNVMREGEKNI